MEQRLTGFGPVAKRSVSFRNFPKLSVSFRFVPELSVSFRWVPSGSGLGRCVAARGGKRLAMTFRWIFSGRVADMKCPVVVVADLGSPTCWACAAGRSGRVVPGLGRRKEIL